MAAYVRAFVMEIGKMVKIGREWNDETVVTAQVITEDGKSKVVVVVTGETEI